ncbi:class I SAM-dependent methyltransferase [Candidatus Woesearchaeota archaeon]|nr:class I SAM-dependent methyltransferase [Candidatus Woesearchaeota archaeon]
MVYKPKNINFKKAEAAAEAAKKSYGTKKVADSYDPWTIEDNKDYELESKKIIEIAKKYGNHNNKTLLDIGCGTGTHLSYLEKHYDCTGLDPFESMLRVARKKLKKTKLIKGDMRYFNLKKKFDVIISLYSVISYSGTYSVFKKVLKNIYNHLNEGGILIIDPFFQKEPGKKGDKYWLYNEPKKWIKIMSDIGFEAKFYKTKFLDNPKKGLYIAIKR